LSKITVVPNPIDAQCKVGDISLPPAPLPHPLGSASVGCVCRKLQKMPTTIIWVLENEVAAQQHHSHTHWHIATWSPYTFVQMFD